VSLPIATARSATGFTRPAELFESLAAGGLLIALDDIALLPLRIGRSIIRKAGLFISHRQGGGSY
jgi:hypothetical protein